VALGSFPTDHFPPCRTAIVSGAFRLWTSVETPVPQRDTTEHEQGIPLIINHLLIFSRYGGASPYRPLISVAPPWPPHSLPIVPLSPGQRDYGEAMGRLWCRVGGTGGQRLDGLGRQARFGWVAETRDTGKGPEPGLR
jgi:hypothetical protein